MVYQVFERHSLCISTLINYTKSIRIKLLVVGTFFFKALHQQITETRQNLSSIQFSQFQHLFFIRNSVTRKIIIQLNKNTQIFLIKNLLNTTFSFPTYIAKASLPTHNIISRRIDSKGLLLLERILCIQSLCPTQEQNVLVFKHLTCVLQQVAHFSFFAFCRKKSVTLFSG